MTRFQCLSMVHNFWEKMMAKPKQTHVETCLLGTPILKFIAHDHLLVILAEKIDWPSLESHFEGQFKEGIGQPPLAIRLVLGLFLLKYLNNLSDEDMVTKFTENPYYQHFCGNRYFEHALPCNPSSLSRWRKRLDKKCLERLLRETIDLMKRERLAKPREFGRVYLDTTVQEKTLSSQQMRGYTTASVPLF